MGVDSATDGAVGAATGRSPGGHVTLRVRLTAWVVAVNTLIIWTTGTVFWLYQKWSIDESINDRRITRARLIAAQLRPFTPDGLTDRLGGVSSELSRQFLGDELLIQVRDSRGMVVASSSPARFEPEQIGLWRVLETGVPAVTVLPRGLWDGGSEGPRHDPPARVVVVPMASEDGRWYALVFGVSDGFAREQMRIFRGVLLVMFFVGPVAAAVSGWFIAGLAVAPFERLRRLVSRLKPESSSTSLQDDSLGNSAEVVRLARELDSARARVAERFAAQERFLSNVSHELKTPISVMLIEAQTIDRAGLSPAGERFVESVEDEMSRLGRLIESFLTLSRIQDGKGLARFRAYAVNDLIMDGVDDCAMMAEQHRVRLVPELLADDRWLDASVSGEPELLRTMLDNLIRNALRFSPEEGRVTVRASITPEEQGKGCTASIAVEDEGPGIPPHLIGTIFDRFAQASNQPRHGRGHGLGLTIAMGIAELHRGSIAVASRAPHGCVFTVTLPARSADASSPDVGERDGITDGDHGDHDAGGA
ncbi:MAG: HAMP domain-containing histidine kinase [Phycisphaeraceae bacterium]|nr:HAMP domain-containing histidine kinase [Phycisphaeraceae bacterium]